MSGDKQRYVLDANVFIEARRMYYGFDLCPDFWRALIRQHTAKRVCSIQNIKDELTAVKDSRKMTGFQPDSTRAAGTGRAIGRPTFCWTETQAIPILVAWKSPTELPRNRLPTRRTSRSTQQPNREVEPVFEAPLILRARALPPDEPHLICSET